MRNGGGGEGVKCFDRADQFLFSSRGNIEGDGWGLVAEVVAEFRHWVEGEFDGEKSGLNWSLIVRGDRVE